MKKLTPLQESGLKKIVEHLSKYNRIDESKSLEFLQKYQNSVSGQILDRKLKNLHEDLLETGDLTPQIVNQTILDYVESRLKKIIVK